MLKMLLVMCVSLLTSASFAATIDVHGFFPAKCVAQLPSKASMITNARISEVEEGYQIEFDLALIECAKGATKFATYQPRPEEFLEVYPYPEVTFEALHLPIASYAQGKNFTRVSFVVPRADADKMTLRLDVFLYYARIPYRLTIERSADALTATMFAM